MLRQIEYRQVKWMSYNQLTKAIALDMKEMLTFAQFVSAFDKGLIFQGNDDTLVIFSSAGGYRLFEQ